MTRVRVRQHVNPLSEFYQIAVTPPDWQTVFAELNQPLHLDIGCARGRFILRMAEEMPQWNFLGLEIRGALVEEANRIAIEKGLKNLYYLSGNANNSLLPVLQSLPFQSLRRVSIQFPDPWFKNKHLKRRMVQPALVREIAQFLVGEGEVFLQSDVQEVAEKMWAAFAENDDFISVHPDVKWLDYNPLPVATEREIATQKKGLPVYRALFKRV